MLVQKAWKAHAEAFSETALHYEKAGDWKEAAANWKTAYNCCAKPDPKGKPISFMKKMAIAMREQYREQGLHDLEKVWANVEIQWAAAQNAP